MKWDAMIFYERRDAKNEGKIEGKIEGVIELLEEIGEIPSDFKDKILNETDLEKIRDDIKEKLEDDQRDLRKEVIESTQSSVKSLGEMISLSQKSEAEHQKKCGKRVFKALHFHYLAVTVRVTSVAPFSR